MAMDGLRTERVVLEVTYKWPSHPSKWNWSPMVTLKPGESVRVVGDEERQAERLRECAVAALDRECDEAFIKAERLTRERDAAIRERESLREQLESVACRAATAETALAEIKSLDYTRAAVNGAAWQANKFAAKALEAASGGKGHTVTEGDYLSTVRDDGGRAMPKGPAPGLVAKRAASGGGEQPRGWLTEDEREIIAGIADDDEYTEEGQNIAKGLLARSSPPEVVLPKLHTRCEVNEANNKSPCLWFRRPDVIAAIAAAGGAVKEVGRG